MTKNTTPEPVHPRVIRPLGAMELFSSSRHTLGLYRCVIISARYALPSAGHDLESAITTAVATVVGDQPMMRVGIAAADTQRAAFVPVDTIRLTNHIEFRDSTATSKEEYEKEVATTHGGLHDQLFPGIETRPPWKAIVLQAPEGILERPSVDIVFAFHHALMGGTGGRDFHAELITALNSPPAEALGPLLSFPEAPRIPESQEDAVPLKNSYLFLAKTVWGMTAPAALKKKEEKIWAGADIDFSRPKTSHIRPVDVSVDVLGSLLSAARENGATLTTLIDTLVLASLAKHLPADQLAAFKTTIPISLMPYVRPNIDAELKDKLRTIYTGYNQSHTLPQVKKFHAAAEGADLNALIWTTAAQGKTALGEKLKTLPHDDVAGLMPMISDIFKFWNDKDGKPRDTTYEVSNVGVLKTTGADGGWAIGRMMFTNSASVPGPAFSVNVASVVGGGLTIALVRGEGIMEADLLESIAEDLEAWMTSLHETGKFT